MDESRSRVETHALRKRLLTIAPHAHPDPTRVVEMSAQVSTSPHSTNILRGFAFQSVEVATFRKYAEHATGHHDALACQTTPEVDPADWAVYQAARTRTVSTVAGPRSRL